MRILVLFDLPASSSAHRKDYTQFRKFLIDDGYSMLQFSVYTRIAIGRDNMNAHLDRLKKNLPKEGSVTTITMTDKQFADRMVMRGEKPTHDHANGFGAQLTLMI
ncbi:CRISPR-associated endonuclease Cas2 [Eggerthellaceae bacterium zg-997]|nr:CRISPR-associated endonuclease Cas2 [Eggerthellaceae bacterium zg-997]